MKCFGHAILFRCQFFLFIGTGQHVSAEIPSATLPFVLKLRIEVRIYNNPHILIRFINSNEWYFYHTPTIP